MLATCRLGVNYPHDVDIPLTNNIPVSATDSVFATLSYPDLIVSNIAVSDLNDSVLRVYDVPEGLDPNGVLTMPPIDSVAADLGVKPVRLLFPGSTFGVFKGNYVVCDEQGGRCVIPYQITKNFVDPFSMSPFISPHWRVYNPSDSQHVVLNYRGPALQFSFPVNDSTGVRSVGVVSRFRLAGDFSISVDYKLRDDMLDGFEVGFFVSPKKDTSRWLRKGGLLLAGNLTGTGPGVTITARTGGSLTLNWTEVYDGRMRIERDGGKMTLIYQELPSTDPDDDTVKIGTFEDDTVYVHLRMDVDNFIRSRHCEWDNFCVSSGKVVF
jgi:hypothetical protein